MTDKLARGLNQSTISTADTCQMRLTWWLDPDMPYTSGVHRAAGTGYHAGLAHHYTAKMNGEHPEMSTIIQVAYQSIDDEIAKAEDRFNWVYQPETKREPLDTWDLPTMRLYVRRLLETYFSNSHQWPDDYQVVAVEQPFEVEWKPGWYRRGVIDLVTRKDGYDFVIDHKTAKRKWAANKSDASATPQAAWYQSAWTEISGATNVEFVYDLMAADGTFERRTATRTPGQIQATIARADLLTQLIDKGGPYLPNPSSFLCSENYCDYWNLCPYGKTLNDNTR